MQAYASLEQATEELIQAGRAMRSARLVVAREGNLSARIGPERVLVTPAGADKGELSAEDLVVVALDGTAKGDRRPSTEVGMHLEIYRRRPDVLGVAHGHPAHATAFAVAGRTLDACLLPEVITTLGAIPLSEYATPSTAEVAAVVGPLAESHDAFLLRNHGAVACGSSVREAVDRLETVEQLAYISWLAESLGGARALSPEQIARLMEIRAL